MTQPPDFDAAFRERLVELFRWRRDVRRFRSDALADIGHHSFDARPGCDLIHLSLRLYCSHNHNSFLKLYMTVAVHASRSGSRRAKRRS